MAWVKINHPEADVSSTEVSSSVSSDHPDFIKSSQILSEILVLPESKVKEAYKKTKSITSQKTVCITEDKVLQELKQQEAEKQKAEEEKIAKKLERTQKQKKKEEMK